MIIIKNILGEDLILSNLGTTLLIGESKDLTQILSRSKILDNIPVIIELVTEGKIEVRDMINSVVELDSLYMFLYSGKSSDNRVLIDNLDDLAQNIANAESEETFYYVRDTFKSKRNDVIVKTFNGNADTVYIYTSSADVKLRITLNGIVLPIEQLSKRQTFELELGRKAENLLIEFKSTGSTNIEVFIDGVSNDTKEVIQSFVDNWKETDTKENIEW